jgi:hypothetical protein
MIEKGCVRGVHHGQLGTLRIRHGEWHVAVKDQRTNKNQVKRMGQLIRNRHGNDHGGGTYDGTVSRIKSTKRLSSEQVPTKSNTLHHENPPRKREVPGHE